MKLDDDFSNILQESRLEKQKPMLIALFVVIAIIAAISWATFAYLNQSTSNSSATNPNVISDSDDKARQEASKATANKEVSSAAEYESAAALSATDHTSATTNQSTNAPSSSSYDPNKCDSLKSQADNLKTASDQKKVAYDSAFAARKNYGYFYEQYGNSASAQQAYDVQETQLNTMQADWQDALNKQNAAYSKYQECRAGL